MSGEIGAASSARLAQGAGVGRPRELSGTGVMAEDTGVDPRPGEVFERGNTPERLIDPSLRRTMAPAETAPPATTAEPATESAGAVTPTRLIPSWVDANALTAIHAKNERGKRTLYVTDTSKLGSVVAVTRKDGGGVEVRYKQGMSQDPDEHPVTADEKKALCELLTPVAARGGYLADLEAIMADGAPQV